MDTSSHEDPAAPSLGDSDRQASGLTRSNTATNTSSPSRSDSQNPIVEATQDDDDDVLSSPKAQDILEACKWRDISRLRSLAEAEGGFLTDALRRQAWPILLGVDATPRPQDDLAYADDASGDWRDLPRHRDEDQVQLDVNRSFIYYPNNQSDAELNQRKSELSDLINEVLRRHPFLCYFQGYHDISQVLLLVLAPERRAIVLARLSVLRIRDFMLPSFGPTTAQLRLLPDIIHDADPELRKHLAGIEPFYALAGTLTMYAHNIERYRDIVRLFDVFLAREPVFTIYVFAQIILNRRHEIFEIDEPDMLHVILGKVPPKMNLDKLITDAANLFEQHPPESLRYWRRIPNSSALKTARDVEVCARQSIEEGSELFEKQVKELRWVEFQERIKKTLWVYRRPAKAAGLALAVGLMAIYLRRNTTLVQRIAAFFL